MTRVATIMCGSNPHHINYNKLGDADRKAQALVPVCCFVNKAIIRKAGNDIMNFVENENSRILPNVQSPIIYFLMDGDEVVYVGQSKIGLARPYSHKDKKFTKIAIINCKESELDDKETEFIKKYKPKYNKMAGKSDYSYARIKTIIKNQTNIRNFNVYDVRKLVTKLGLKTHIFNGSIYINAEDFDKMFAFVKETSNGIANKEEWKKKVF